MCALLVLLAAVTMAAGTAPKNGEDLIREMHQRYAGKWYRTLTFVQKTTYPDGHVETWFEAVKLPGFLRIDIAPLDSGKAILFRNDTLYNVERGQVQPGRPFVHPLLVLGFDVYFDPAERTIDKLKALKFDLTKLRTDTWQGKPVYVVGADKGDDRSAQFWIDQESLLFVRLLRPTPSGGVSEAQFNKYQKARNTWIAPEVLFFQDGKPGNREEYGDVRTGVGLDATLFDPAKWGRAGWIKGS